MNQLKAYAVTDGYEGYGGIVFAKRSVEARRIGAGDLGIDFDEVESCRRQPDLDQYAPGPVPPLDLIAHGWWFECVHCGRRVSNNMDDEILDDGLNPADFVPRPAGKNAVFCGVGCECADHMKQRGRDEAEEALIEVFEAKFSGATLTGIHVYDGPQLLPPEDRGGIRYAVYFTFPGSKYAATWQFGDNHVSLDRCDAEAYKAWRGIQD